MACYQGLPDKSEIDFPSGMRVLVVDDDLTSLSMVNLLLAECGYEVTCSQAVRVLSLLRENKERFDIVLADIDMLGINSFRFLQLVVLEMDLPVIIMSDDDNVKAAMEGILQGACGYIVKPVSKKELETIWQHVVRKRLCGKNDTSYCLSYDKKETGGPSKESIVEVKDDDQNKEKNKYVSIIRKIGDHIGIFIFLPFWFFAYFFIRMIHH